MRKAKSLSKFSILFIILGTVVLVGGSIYAYSYINKSKNVSPTDTSAGVIKSCLSNVETLTKNLSCGNSKYKSASYRCAGGYTGKVGDGVTCQSSSALKNLAENACSQKANCKMLQPAYTETFTSKSFSENNWIVFNKNKNAIYYFNTKGLNTKIANAPTDSWHEVRLSDQNINEDFSYELKGVDISNVEKAVSTFSARGFTPGSVDWKIYGGPGNWNTMDIFVYVSGGKKYITSQYRVGGAYKGMPTPILVPTGTKSIDFKIYSLGNDIVTQYNIGAGYKTAFTYNNHNWINNYVLMASFAPKGTTTVGSYKSFTYLNTSGKFAFKTKYSETFAKQTFSNKNWTVKQTSPNFKYGFSTKGIVFTNISALQTSPELWSTMTFDRNISGDVILTAKKLALNPTTSNGSKAFFTYNGYLPTNQNDVSKWDQVYGQLRKYNNTIIAEAGYSDLAHTKWFPGLGITLPKGVVSADFRIKRVASTVTVSVNYGTGYKNLLTVHTNNQVKNYTDFGLYNPTGLSATGSLGGFIYQSR